MITACPDCRYAVMERAAIHEFDGGASRAQAEAWAASERCPRHVEPQRREGAEGKTDFSASQRPGGELNITVRRWEPRGLSVGEFVGAPRTLAGKFRIGFDGSKEIVALKYRDWLAGEVERGGPVREKLRGLLPQARSEAGLVLVCVVPEIGEEIRRALEGLAAAEGIIRETRETREKGEFDSASFGVFGGQ